MSKIYKGVLIDQSVKEPDVILSYGQVASSRATKLEGESFRGEVLFHNIEVSEENVWAILSQVAASIKSPGWYFHLVSDEQLYIVMPRVILLAKNNGKELSEIITYATDHGIHPEQLDLKKLFTDPYA